MGLNNLKNQIEIEAHFDLLLSLQAYNLYQLLWQKVHPGNEVKPYRIWRHLIKDGAFLRVKKDIIRFKPRHRKAILSLLKIYEPINGLESPLLNGKKLFFVEKRKV